MRTTCQHKNENASKTVYRFPTDKDERQRWIDVVGKINANLKVTSETVVCELHWPHGYETVRKKGKNRPKYPPSIFEGIPQSILPNPSPKARETTNFEPCEKYV